MTPGKIKVKARVQFEGVHSPTSAEIEIESLPSNIEPNFLDKPFTKKEVSTIRKVNIDNITTEQKKAMLNEVELQQTQFGTAR